LTTEVPSVAHEIFERLAAGEWQSAPKLLEPRERDLWQERQPVEYSDTHRNHLAHFDLRDLTQMRQTLDKSLGGLPWEVREKIAQHYSPPTPKLITEESRESDHQTTPTAGGAIRLDGRGHAEECRPIGSTADR
jgi:hypothetical protein